MREWAEYSVDERGGRVTLSITGPLLVSGIGRLDPQLRAHEGSVQFVDISGASAVDTVGAWVVHRFAEEKGAEITGASESADILLQAVEDSASTADVVPPRPYVLGRVSEQVGIKVYEFAKGFRQYLGFLGAILMAFLSVVRHPRRFRMKALVRQMELVGVSSLPIIGLMSFLIGIVIAQQGAVQLQQFGAETLTVNLVGRITLRELGVLMTAIMVAGRQRFRLCGADRHDEADRGNRRDAHHRRLADGSAGAAAHSGFGADDAAAGLLCVGGRDHRRGGGGGPDVRHSVPHLPCPRAGSGAAV